MSIKKVIVLAVLLIIVGVVYFIDKSRVEKVKEQEEESKQLFALTPDDILRVKVERGDEVIVAEVRDDDRWMVVEPYEAAGDKASFRSLVNGIGNGKIQKKVEDPGELKNYGLDDPKVKVTVTVREASAEHTLLFGNKIPSGPDYFAKREGDPTVFTVYSYIFTSADKSLLDFLDKSLVDFEVKDVKSFEVLSGDRMLAFDLSNEKDPRMLQPYQLRAKDTDVRSLLWKVKNGRVEKFGPRGVQRSELGSYGLVEPATKVVLGFGAEGSDRSYKSLLIGDATEDEGKTRFWAMRERASDVFLIAEDTAKGIYKDPDVLRYDKIARIGDWQAKSLEIQRAKTNEHIILTKEGEEWMMTSPQELPGNSDGIKAFLDKFSGFSGAFKVKDYIMGATDMARYHLDEPAYRVTVRSDDLEETFTVSDMIVEKDDAGKTVQRVYAQWGDYPEVVLVMEGTRPIIDVLESPLNEFGEFPTPTPAPTATPAPPPPPTPTAAPEPVPQPEGGDESGSAEKSETGSASQPSATEEGSLTQEAE